MGDNNGGYTLHINLTKEQYEAMRELINVSGHSIIQNHVFDHSGVNRKFTQPQYISMGDIVWKEITRIKG